MADFLRTAINLNRLRSAYATTNDLINLKLPTTPKSDESPLHYFRLAAGLSNDIDKILSNFNEDIIYMVYKLEKMVALIKKGELQSEEAGQEEVEEIKKRIKHLEKKMKGHS